MFAKRSPECHMSTLETTCSYCWTSQGGRQIRQTEWNRLATACPATIKVLLLLDDYGHDMDVTRIVSTVAPSMMTMLAPRCSTSVKCHSTQGKLSNAGWQLMLSHGRGGILSTHSPPTMECLFPLNSRIIVKLGGKQSSSVKWELIIRMALRNVASIQSVNGPWPM